MASGSIVHAKRKCCVEGCPHTEINNPELEFYRFPNRPWEIHRRTLWIKAVNRQDKNGEQWNPKQHSRICSAHFVRGKMSKTEYDISYVPTIFPNRPDNVADGSLLEWIERVRENESKNHGTEPMEISETLYVDEPTDCEIDNVPDESQKSVATHSSVSCQTVPYVEETLNQPNILFCWQNECDSATQTTISLPCTKVDRGCGHDVEMNYGFLGYSSIKTPLSMSQLAGVSFDFFMALLTFIVPGEEGQPMYFKKISKENRLLIFLMKMKLGISYCALGCIFGITTSAASMIFRQVLQTLTLRTQSWIFWPSKESVQRNLPRSFHNYRNCRCIIDCTEIRTDTPPTVEQRVLMYSNYKGTFTVKFLIVITPDGFVCKVSKGYGGRATDSYITNDSGFLNLIEPGDLVLADKGFPQIKSELSKRNGTLVIPPFAYNPQFSEEEINETYKIASVRIHVERAIQRIKISRILDHFSDDLFPYTDAIMHMCCVIANSRPPLISEL